MITDSDALKILMDDYKQRTGKPLFRAHAEANAIKEIGQFTELALISVSNLANRIREAVADGLLTPEAAIPVNISAEEAIVSQCKKTFGANG